MATFKIYCDGDLVQVCATKYEAIKACLELPDDLPITVEMTQELVLDLKGLDLVSA